MELTTILFQLIRYELLDIIPKQEIVNSIDENTLQKLYKISKAHDISHLVGGALNKLGFTEGEIISKFQKQQMVAVCRYERMKYDLIHLSSFLNEKGIDFVPLKGAVLRNYYPEPWMRTSCDIDILIKKTDLNKAKELLVNEFEYKLHEEGSHDVSFFSNSGVHIELHYSLIERDRIGIVDLPLENIWDNLISSSKLPHQYEMNDEYFYYYQVVHTAKHFIDGGCGIRPIIDLYILNHRLEYTESSRNKVLENGGLLTFAGHMSYLAEVWLGEAEHSNISKELEDYIVKGGVYGVIDNLVVVHQVRKGGKIKYAMSKIWLPYETIRFHYPILNKHKWFLPLCQMRRWFKLLFCGGVKRSVRNLKINSEVTDSKAEAIKKLLNQLEL